MITLLDNIAVLHHQNHIRLLYGGQTMGHNKAGSALHHSGKGALNLHFCAGIDGRGCLVQYQHGRQTQHDSCNTQKLLLTLRKTSAILGNHCIIALRQTFDKAVCMGSLCRCNHFLLRGLRFAHTDIVTNGTRSQPGLLQHHTIIGSQAASRDIPDVCTIHPDTSFLHIIKTHQQIDDRSLTASGRSYNRHSLSRFYFQIKVLDQLLLRNILKLHIGKLYVALRLFQHPAVLCIGNLRLLLYQVKDTSRADKGILQLCHHTRYFIKGLGILIRIAQKTGQASYADAASDCQKRAENPHTRIHKTVDKTGGRVGKGGEKNSFQRAFL